MGVFTGTISLMISEPDQFLRACFDVAVAAADPLKTIPRALPDRPKGRVIVIGAGKASARMAEAVEQQWGPCEGLVITRYGYARPTQKIEIVEAAHPVPDLSAFDATSRMLGLVQDLDENDLVLCLISGGGSSLFCAPAHGMNLPDMQAVHRALLQSGTPIGEMNIIRKHLSRIKGGQLAAATYPAKLLCLMISDVPGDDPGDIASGPTVAETSRAEDALNIIKRRNITMPDAAMNVLKRGSSVVKPDDEQLKNVENIVISAPSQSLMAASDFAKSLGVEVQILGDAIEGEARDEARRQVEIVLQHQKIRGTGVQPLLLLSGGECTVSGWEGGVGGPNAEFALAAAIALNGQKGIHLLACDTDGVDGAAEIAGAVVYPDTLLQTNMDAKDALKRNDSHSFFEAAGGQVVTGPTLTNVNDFRAILIG